MIDFIVFPKNWGGAEIHSLGLARELLARGYRVRILEFGSRVYSCRGSRLDGQIEIRHFDESPSSSVGRLIRVMQTLRGNLAIMIKGGGTQEGSLKLDIVCRILYKNLIVIEHLMPQAIGVKLSTKHFGGLLPGLGLWWHHRRWLRRIRSLMPEKVICVSDAVRQAILQEPNCYSEDRVITIHNGIDVRRYRPDPKVRERRLLDWGIPPSARVFGTLSRLSPMKAVHLAVEAIVRLREKPYGGNIWLIIGGDGPLLNQLVDLSRERGIEDRVRFIGYQQQAETIYPAYDVFLVPSIREGMPLALLEAMSCGCPPITTAVGGVPEVLSDPSHGWLVPRDDPEAFFSCVLEAAQLPSDALQRMGQRARDHVAARFDESICFARIVNLIDRVLD